MGDLRRDEWDEDYEIYSEAQVEGVLNHCGVEIVSQTGTHFLCLCPFHGNSYSPAFAIDKGKGLWTCFNPSCDQAGTIRDLLRRTKGYNRFEVERALVKYRNASPIDFEERLRAVMANTPDFQEYDTALLEYLRSQFKGSPGESYMHSRGFTDDTLDYFEIGYSAKRNMVTVPMHDPNGMPIGFIGRTASMTDKQFKNSKDLPKSRTIWNIHRAKRAGGTIIVCEASFDSMRIHQAGYPNVGGLLGGHLSDFQADMLNRHFSTIIIMTDFETKPEFKPNCKRCKGSPPNQYGVRCRGHRAGRDLGRSIAAKLPHKKILWAAYDDTCVYPHGAKDASDLTDVEIRQCLGNAVTNVEYQNWEVESLALVV